jgi:large subunit ribosomal protein L3
VKKAILGTKVGMLQIYDDTGRVVPVTAIQAGPCTVVQKKTVERDGYEAVQMGFGACKERRVTQPLKGHFAVHEIKPLKYLKEFRLESAASYEVGQEIKADIFKAGEWVDVTGTTKGKGFAGAIKRHAFHRGPMEHGSKYHRRPGSMGAKGPARVFVGRKGPGQYGGDQVTVQKLLVVRVDPEKNLILVRGAVPGARKGLLSIKNSVKEAK